MMLKVANLHKTRYTSSQLYWQMTKNSLSYQNSKANKCLLSQLNSLNVLPINPPICLTKTYFRVLLEEEKPNFKVVQVILMEQLKVLLQLILLSVPISLFRAQICINLNSKPPVQVYFAAIVSVLIATRVVMMKITILHK